MSSERICDQCSKPIAEGEGLRYQESVFVRGANENAHADSETALYDVHDACADAFGGNRRTAFLTRFRAGVERISKAGPPKDSAAS